MMYQNRPLTVVFLLFTLLSAYSANAQSRQGRNSINFDKNWRFIKEDVSGAEKPVFDDSKWRTLDVPHDWSIEGPIAQTNPTGSGGGYMPAGIGWYRKTFTVSPADAKRKVSVEFDGVMANSEVFVNGISVGKRPYGYISFAYDITPQLKFGQPNSIAVRVDNTPQPASRWYTGAGIYRHVRLVSTGTAHFDHWGVFIRPMQVTAQKAILNVQAKVTNQSAASGIFTLQTTVIDPSGKPVKTSTAKQSIAAGKTVDYTQNIEVANPSLWDLQHTGMYKVVTKLVSGTTTADDVTTPVGIRETKFLAATGFWLNGKNIKLYGVCLHQDGGAVGSAIPLAVWERRFTKLKEIGANAIRTSHNEVAPEFLDLCDRMGMLVMDETFDTWEANKVGRGRDGGNGGGYNLYFKQWWDKDTRDQVLRDRNHPSIVIYSVGNEIHDNLKDTSGFRKYKMQQDLIHQYDPSRPVTMALLQPNGTSQAYKSGLAEMMDITGQNYRENELVDYHNAHPDRVVIGTENTHVLSQWLALRDNPFMSGQFLWTGVDYLGEDIWPSRGATFGLIDRTGGWHTNGLQRAAWWSAKPVVYIQRSSPLPPRPARVLPAGAPGAQAGTNPPAAGTPAPVLDGPTAAAARGGGVEFVSDWTPADPATYTNARVQVFSNADETELFLNGKSLGVKTKSRQDSSLFWNVPFEKGTLKAIARNKGKQVATDELRTAGEPAKIILTADKSMIGNNWDDVSFVTASIVDANGVVCPNSDKLIQFGITGSGVLAAVDNADRNDHDPYQAMQRKTYKGTCIALIKASASTGKMTIKASAPGLPDATISLTAKP